MPKRAAALSASKLRASQIALANEARTCVADPQNALDIGGHKRVMHPNLSHSDSFPDE